MMPGEEAGAVNALCRVSAGFRPLKQQKKKKDGPVGDVPENREKSPVFKYFKVLDIIIFFF